MKNKLYIVLSIIFPLLIALFYILNITLNTTPSMKYGFYLKSNEQVIKRGDYVSICLKAPYMQLGLRQGYLEKGTACNGSQPLIKRVVALPFEEVELTQSSVIISGVPINAKTAYFDSNHRPLVNFPRGKFKQNCYWLIGDYDISHSWDSRYWGCVGKDQILTKLKPLLTW